MISWLPPRHALGEYKLTCPTFNSVLFSPVGFELCRTLVVPSGWSLSWDGLVSSSSYDAPSWCSVVLLLRGAVLCAPSWCFVVLILRCALLCCSFVVAVQRLTAWKLQCCSRWLLLFVSILEKRVWVPFSPYLQVKEGFNTLVPGCSLLDPSQVIVLRKHRCYQQRLI